MLHSIYVIVLRLPDGDKETAAFLGSSDELKDKLFDLWLDRDETSPEGVPVGLYYMTATGHMGSWAYEWYVDVVDWLDEQYSKRYEQTLSDIAGGAL